MTQSVNKKPAPGELGIREHSHQVSTGAEMGLSGHSSKFENLRMSGLQKRDEVRKRNTHVYQVVPAGSMKYEWKLYSQGHRII